MKLVEVTWGDAWTSNSGWKDAKELPEHRPLICKTVGYLIKKDKHGVMLAGTYTEGDGYNAIQFRPMGMVQSIRVLK
jgi:hypothetical protein